MMGYGNWESFNKLNWLYINCTGMNESIGFALINGQLTLT
jgi:hypothetical protein